MNSRCNDTIVLDIGGTHMRAGFLQDEAKPNALIRTPQERDSVLHDILHLVDGVLSSSAVEVKRMVVGCPGLISREGNIEAALYWPAAGVKLRKEIEAKLNIRIEVINDANLQAQSFAKSLNNAIYLSFGTGVGGAIISKGEVLLGSRGYAGEFGHVKVCGEMARCKCGLVGCLDTVAAGYWLSKKLGHLWWEQPLEAKAKEALSKAGTATGQVVAPSAKTLDISNVFLAGHLVGYPSFTDAVENTLRNLGVDVDLHYHIDSWPLAVAGAARWIETKGKQP